jgi:hypothetical protein
VYIYNVVKNHNYVAVQVVLFFYVFVMSLSVCMYIFYLVVVLLDKLKITVFHMYGLVKYNFYCILLIKRQYFDYALIGKATERTSAMVVSSDTLPKHWSCGDYEFNIILSLASFG